MKGWGARGSAGDCGVDGCVGVLGGGASRWQATDSFDPIPPREKVDRIVWDRQEFECIIAVL